MAHSAASLLQSAAAGLFATLFPSDCRFCGAPLENISRLPVCPACLAGIHRLDIPVCSVCGERLALAAAPPDDRCGLCRRVEPPFAQALAYGSYDGALRDLLQLLKYEGVRPAAGVLGRRLGEVLLTLRGRLDGPPLVIPVPLHAQKLRQRGFNQSHLIARAALRNLHRGTGTPWELAAGALLRVRATASQTGLTPHQRRENVRGAFAVARADRVRGRDLLIIDDVFTTGTTVSECARVLRRAGAARVLVATVARALKPEVERVLPPHATFDAVPPPVRAAHA